MNRFFGFFMDAAQRFSRFLMAITQETGGQNNGGGGDGNNAIDPVYNALSTFGPALIGLLAAVMALYAAILGFSYSKAETADERDSAKKKLINGLIGFGVILILIVLLYALRGPITGYVNTEVATV